MSRIFTQNISDTECIGDSLSKINSNSENLDTAVQSLSGGSIGGNISLYGANRSITNTDNFALSFGTNNTERVRISNSGNVGIGTQTPSVKLDIASSGTTSTIMRVKNDTTSVYLDANNGFAYLNTFSDHPLLFGTNNSERMRIDSSGNMLISRTSTVAQNSGWYFGPAGASRGEFTSGQFLTLNRIDIDGTVISFGRSNSEVGSISVTGTTTSYIQTSDYRLKENVQPLQNALTRVNQLKPSTYSWKVDNSPGEGFIAHELAEVCPLAVTGQKDAVNEDGSIKPQGVDNSKIVPLLVKAIQELTTKIETLEAKLANLS